MMINTRQKADKEIGIEHTMNVNEYIVGNTNGSNTSSAHSEGFSGGCENNGGCDALISEIMNGLLITDGKLTEAFYDDAVRFRGLPVSEILAIYCIPEDALSSAEINKIEERLENWRTSSHDENSFTATSDVPVVSTAIVDKGVMGIIAKNRFNAMKKLLEQTLANLKTRFKTMKPYEKKRLCEIIDKLPRDSAEEYTTSNIRAKIGISQTLYYKYLRLERFGMEQDKKKLSDIEAVRKVFEYKGFKKGSRQIYMMMPSIVGRKMGIRKIRRIMFENGMGAGELTIPEQQVPYEEAAQKKKQPTSFGTGVLIYGDRKFAYAFADIDPDTGKLKDFIVAEEPIARQKTTKTQSVAKPSATKPSAVAKPSATKPSAEGMTEGTAEGKTVGRMPAVERTASGYKGIARFFANFRSECDYSSCKTLEELRDLIDRYKDYYNNERRIWERDQMTPVEIEKQTAASTTTCSQ